VAAAITWLEKAGKGWKKAGRVTVHKGMGFAPFGIDLGGEIFKEARISKT
jgi:hypothetical protein